MFVPLDFKSAALEALAGPVRVELTSPESESGALPLGHGPAY